MGRRLDEITTRLNDVRQDTRIRVQPRVRFVQGRRDDVRAVLAQRGGQPLPDGSDGPIDKVLDDMELQIEIATAQLELDDATDRATFERSVSRLIRAYGAHAQLLEATAWGTRPGSTDQRAVAIRAGLERIREQLRRYRDLSDEVAGSLRAGVLAAIDDLDATSRTREGDHGNQEDHER